jgi:anthranilate synthase component II
MILIIDNYDSFTYNLYQYIGDFETDIEVYRNNMISVDEIRRKKPTHVIISPGPGFPSDAGICKELIKSVGGEFPILGVCLGHQAIGEAYGAKVIHAPNLMHGKASTIELKSNCILFNSLPSKIQAGRYHSLIVEKETLPDELKVTAVTTDGEIMGIQHKTFPVFGIQFHPESVLTPDGKKILKNFVDLKGGRQ